MKRISILLASAVAIAAMPAHAKAPREGGDRQSARVDPYIEANQVFAAELSPGDDTVTYSQVAVGVDASVQGRNNGVAASVRYERTFGYGDRVSDSATLSGIARGYAAVVPQALTVEAGALATRTRVDASGGGSAVSAYRGPSESRIYSAYAGPTLHTSAGEAEINANYRVGYARAEAPDAIVAAPGAPRIDVFDESVVQSANVHAGLRPGAPLPVGIGVGAGFYQEDTTNLDSRVRDLHWRSDVTVPLGPSLAVVGGLGYEDVEISNRDAVRDGAGNPVIGADGRFVTDTSSPRRLAYDVSGLIWDVGVVWRPSSRTAAEAHVGRRYDSTTYYGSFAWAPDSRTSVNLSVYDGITGFGGQLTNALAALPTDFAAIRNPVTGDLQGCVSSLEGGNCLTGVLGSVRSAVFRGRGVQASVSQRLGRMTGGIGAGYDRRKFIGAPGTVLAAANGVVDESYWIASYLTGQLGPRDSFTVNSRVQWLRSGFAGAGDATVLGAAAAYRRYLVEGLSANAAVSVDRFDSDAAGQDLATAAALLGLRYDF
ncbi:preprotein translocase subunit YajC [Tsuneonella sp. YG55]|uniref:Preprotein translocase subunit YajC n=1 Tax=Tsuneonella litorea TaxID=2976475 RepID=A0A9X3AMQ6_9SPHN|nr:preprotein translocase subunit YajC [Tsuneonella litorea]MCT2558752.1 preprotein translocase subunit YajC [Tsuneonella litorea]